MLVMDGWMNVFLKEDVMKNIRKRNPKDKA